MVQTRLGVTACIVMLVLAACHNGSNDVGYSKQAIHQIDPIVEFQREVIPIVEDVLAKQFPVDNAKNDAFLEQGTLYFDNKDIRNLKVVLLIDQPDTQEMKAFRKELEQKLEDKVIFKKAKHNPKFLSELAKEIAIDVTVLVGKGKLSTVYYNISDECIDIEAKLTDAQIEHLIGKYGSDYLRITNKEPAPGILLDEF
ncbi:hypothetical protein [Paenibacillus sp. MMS18-CY102]|uniref:hypothetical protein n=1 Tax=Paenibacillus sp. MMS18-CY102 TaxID=2682849 RepID=UPI001365AA4E|nr:hypothetical protein [Paenibacillus sp. MMS18-CY102]MWC29558.1 hypothetical protein [Paenibacillus sp. MMS18-CY102]